MSLKNKVYIVFSFILVVFMILLTFFYLSSHKKEAKPITNVTTTSSSIIESTSSSSQNKVETKVSSDKPSEKKSETKESETKTNKSSDTKDNHEYVSNYSYVYEAVGGDDFIVVSKLTGVDVDTLAKTNSLSKDAVFKKGDRIFVP